jgi:hypothetical protein
MEIWLGAGEHSHTFFVGFGDGVLFRLGVFRDDDRGQVKQGSDGYMLPCAISVIQMPPGSEQ